MSKGSVAEERATPPAGTASPETSAEPECVHHWIIDTPTGATSSGVCKICGERREFQNHASDFIWEGDSVDTFQQGSWRKPITELVRPPSEETDESSFASGGGATSPMQEERLF